MKDELFFCERWGGNYKRPVTPLPRKKAEKLHVAGKPYCVLVGSETRPRATVHMTKRVAIVSFMDGNINPHFVYTFCRNDDKNPSDRLFLGDAIERQYDDNNEVPLAFMYSFWPDGRVLIMKMVSGPESYRQTIEKTADVSGNWSDYPAFGEYDELLRFDRSPTAT